MEDLSITLFEPCHIGELAQIERDTFSVPFREKDFSDIYDSEISNVLVATKNGEVVGYVSFTVIIDECQIINFATKRQYYRQGVGKRVMSALIDYAKSHGVLKVFLEVRESNEPAIALYKSYGFVPVGISKNHFTSPRENAILMNLEF